MGTQILKNKIKRCYSSPQNWRLAGSRGLLYGLLLFFSFNPNCSQWCHLAGLKLPVWTHLPCVCRMCVYESEGAHICAHAEPEDDVRHPALMLHSVPLRRGSHWVWISPFVHPASAPWLQSPSLHWLYVGSGIWTQFLMLAQPELSPTEPSPRLLLF